MQCGHSSSLVGGRPLPRPPARRGGPCRPPGSCRWRSADLPLPSRALSRRLTDDSRLSRAPSPLSQSLPLARPLLLAQASRSDRGPTSCRSSSLRAPGSTEPASRLRLRLFSSIHPASSSVPDPFISENTRREACTLCSPYFPVLVVRAPVVTYHPSRSGDNWRRVLAWWSVVRPARGRYLRPLAPVPRWVPVPSFLSGTCRLL